MNLAKWEKLKALSTVLLLWTTSWNLHPVYPKLPRWIALTVTTVLWASFLNRLISEVVVLDFKVLSTTQGHLRTQKKSNSGHKQMHISKLFSHRYQPSVKSMYKTNHRIAVYTRIKTESIEQQPLAMRQKPLWGKRGKNEKMKKMKKIKARALK